MNLDVSSIKNIFLSSLFFLATATISFSPSAQADANLKNPLSDTKWRLVEFTSMDDTLGTIRPHDPAVYTMHLKSDGTASLQLNCNSATGSWLIEPAADGNSGRFEFGPLAGTRALCPPPSMDESFLAQSSFVRGFLLKENRLYLSLMADGGIYAWEPIHEKASKNNVPKSGDEGGPLNWEITGDISGLNLRENPSASSRVAVTYPPGTVFDNFGCQRGVDRVWCQVQKFGGGPVGYVALEFLQPAIPPTGRPIYGPDDSALRAGQGKFDARGFIPCAQVEGQPMSQCEFGVSRTGGGYATVVIRKPDGLKRVIFFRMGKAIGSDTSEADGYHDLSANQVGDLIHIRVGPERYEVPTAAIFGG